MVFQLSKTWRCLAICVALIAVMLCPSTWSSPVVRPQQSTSLTVSAAISLKDALDELGALYERAHADIKLTFNYGGSGTLQHQVEQGAPVDIFFSAAEKQMDRLESEGLLLSGTRSDLLGNALVLITPAGDSAIHDFAGLSSSTVRTIALGEPSTVPAGMYARQTLDRLGLFAALRKKIVYAKDVRAVLAYVETGNADAGLVYQTDARTSSKVRIAAVAPPETHDPIVYPAAVLKSSRNPEAARAFLDFLEGSQARAIFERYGFLAAKNQPKKN